jgi:5-methylcytosine-specific restriction endonuclease McrA
MSDQNRKKPNYFFVFQNKSFVEESEESYLWAPKKTLDGKKVSHWGLMTEVEEGDYVIHSFQKQIKAISIAKSSAYTFDNPKENAEQWMPDGWKIDTEYFIIDKPIITSDHREAIKSLQPTKNAPFNKLGKGNTGYLFRANKDFFDFIVKQTAVQIDTLEEKRKFLNFCASSIIYEIESEMDDRVIEEINQNPWPSLEIVDYYPSPKVRPTAVQNSGRITYVREPMVSKRALARAKYKCEIDESHHSFTRRFTNQQYMEPHHLIPMSQQGEFDYSLDVEANIVSLCSNCHNQIHYGEGSFEKIKLLYGKRKDELKKAKVAITLENLLSFYNLEFKID